MQSHKKVSATEFCAMLGCSNVTLWRREKDDPNFPKPVYILNKKLFQEDKAVAYSKSLERSEPTHNNLKPKSKPKPDHKDVQDDIAADNQETANLYCAEQVGG